MKHFAVTRVVSERMRRRDEMGEWDDRKERYAPARTLVETTHGNEFKPSPTLHFIVFFETELWATLKNVFGVSEDRARGMFDVRAM